MTLVDNMMLVDSMDDACWFHGWCVLITMMMPFDQMHDAYVIMHHQASPSITKHFQVSSSVFKQLQAISSIFKHPQASSSISTSSSISSVFKHLQCLQASQAFMMLSWCFYDAFMTLSWLMLYDAWFWWFNDVLRFCRLTD